METMAKQTTKNNGCNETHIYLYLMPKPTAT